MSWAKNSVGERGDNIGLPDVTTADNGKIMEVEDGEWKLKEGSSGGGIPAPDSPSDGDVLTYDSTAGEWVAAAPGGGGGGSFVITYTYDEVTEITTLSATGQQIFTAAQSGPVILMQSNFLDADPPTEYTWYYLHAYFISDDPTESAYTFDFGSGGVFYANSLSDYPQSPAPTPPGE